MLCGKDLYVCTTEGHETRFQGVMEQKAKRNWNTWSSMEVWHEKKGKHVIIAKKKKTRRAQSDSLTR